MMRFKVAVRSREIEPEGLGERVEFATSFGVTSTDRETAYQRALLKLTALYGEATVERVLDPERYRFSVEITLIGAT
jgi:hypothetical protein